MSSKTLNHCFQLREMTNVKLPAEALGDERASVNVALRERPIRASFGGILMFACGAEFHGRIVTTQYSWACQTDVGEAEVMDQALLCNKTTYIYVQDERDVRKNRRKLKRNPVSA